MKKSLVKLVVLLYSDIWNFSFWSYDILKCKNFLIGFLYEFGNFKQKNFTFQNVNVKFFCILQQQRPIVYCFNENLRLSSFFECGHFWNFSHKLELSKIKSWKESSHEVSKWLPKKCHWRTRDQVLEVFWTFITNSDGE